MMIGGREQFAARRAIWRWRSRSRAIHRARSVGRMATNRLRPLSELTSSSNPHAGGVSSTESTMTSGIVSCGPKASNTRSRREVGHLKSEIRTAIFRAAPSDDAAAMNPSAPRPAHIVARNRAAAPSAMPLERVAGRKRSSRTEFVTPNQAETVANPRRRIGQCLAYFADERKLLASPHERHRRGNIDDRIEIHGTTLFESANVNFLEWIAQARANIYASRVGMAQERRLVAKYAESTHFARRM